MQPEQNAWDHLPLDICPTTKDSTNVFQLSFIREPDAKALLYFELWVWSISYNQDLFVEELPLIGNLFLVARAIVSSFRLRLCQSSHVR